MNIAFVHNYYIHYRRPLFERLSDVYNIQYFFSSIHETTVRLSSKIKFKILKSIPANRYFSCSPTLPFLLLKGKYALYIAGDALLPNTFLTALICKFLKKPFILWEERWFWSRSFLVKIMWPFARHVYLNSNAIIVPGKKSMEFILSLGVKEKKIFTAPNASSLNINKQSVIKFKDIKENLRLNSKTVILYLGRLEKEKGLEYLLKAFKKLENDIKSLVLLIVGKGSHERELKELCKRLGVRNVHFLGFVSERENASYFFLADIFVYPSVSEVWGLAINEAMSTGKPVVTTFAVGGAYDLIQDGTNGYLVPAKDSNSLYNAIKLIIANPKLKKQMGRASKEIIGNFTYERMCEGFQKAIEFITQEGKVIN